MLHADTRCPVSAHRVADQATALATGQSAEMRIHVSHQVTRNELLEISRCNRTGIYGTVVQSLGIGKHDDHFFRALRKSTLDGLRDMNFVCPLLGADRVAV